MTAETEFRSTHNLPYLQATENYRGGVCTPFKVGTCHGLFYITSEAFQIVSVVNEEPGNGHFTDVLEWFEYAAKRNGKALEMIEFFNDRLRTHMIEKRGFRLKDNGDVIKTFV